MRLYLFLPGLLFLCCINFSYSQSGCTDPSANNYNASAISNDGSCTYDVSVQPYSARGPLFSFAGESSGLVYTNGVLWTHNYSGNASDIFKVDTTTGALLQKVSITNYPNNDWEDITADSNYIYVGDFGNNNGTRIDLRVLKIDKSQLTSTAAVIGATAQAINFSYADQTSFVSNGSNNYDCESVISMGNSLYLFTKDRGDLQTRVYKLSKSPGTYTLSPYTFYNVNGKITGADYNPQKNEVVLIGYMASNKNSFIYYLNNFTGDLFFSGNKRRVEIGNATNDWQTEGITYRSNNELFISCETSYTTASLYTTLKSTMTVVGLNEITRDLNGILIYPNPATNHFEIKSEESIVEIKLMDLTGRIFYTQKPEADSNQLLIDVPANIEPACYLLQIQTARTSTFHKVFLNPGQ